MTKINRVLRHTLTVIDLSLGTLTLFWPGVWHELVHGAVERTTFYVVQGIGITLLMRGLITLRGHEVALLYGVSGPGALFLAWLTADTSSVASIFYLCLASLWIGGAYQLRADRHQSPSGEDSTGVDLT